MVRLLQTNQVCDLQNLPDSKGTSDGMATFPTRFSFSQCFHFCVILITNHFYVNLNSLLRNFAYLSFAQFTKLICTQLLNLAFSTINNQSHYGFFFLQNSFLFLLSKIFFRLPIIVCPLAFFFQAKKKWQKLFFADF